MIPFLFILAGVCSSMPILIKLVNFMNVAGFRGLIMYTIRFIDDWFPVGLVGPLDG